MEIERKFWYEFDIEKKLKDIGAKQIDQNSKHICDEYFDNTDSYFMLLSDYLLRLRHKKKISKWQLKYPSNLAQNIENYYEIEDARQAIECIHELISRNKSKSPSQINDSNFSCISFEEMVNKLNLKCFARINSTRRSFLIENVRIDLDETDFGYRLGEIELILDTFQGNTNENISKTYEKISELTSRLGMNQ